MTRRTDRSHSTVVRIIFELGGRLASHGLSFGTHLLLLAVLGVRDFGQFAALTSTASIASFAWNTNVQGDLSRRISRRVDVKAPWRRYLLRAGATALLVLGALVWMSPDLSGAYWIAGAIGVVEAAYVYDRPALIAQGGQRTMAQGLVVSQAVRLCAVLTLLAADVLDPISATVAQVPGYLAGALVHRRGCANRPLDMVEGVGPPLHWASVAADGVEVYTRYVPTVVLFLMGGGVVAGVYDLTVRFAGLGGEVVASLGVVALPRLATASTDAFRSARSRLLLGGLGMSLAAAAIFAAGFRPMVRVLAEVDPSPVFVAAGVGVLIGSAMFKLTRGVLWALETGAMQILLSQAVAAALLTVMFIVSSILSWPPATLALGVGVAWLVAAVVALQVERSVTGPFGRSWPSGTG